MAGTKKVTTTKKSAAKAVKKARASKSKTAKRPTVKKKSVAKKTVAKKKASKIRTQKPLSTVPLRGPARSFPLSITITGALAFLVGGVTAIIWTHGLDSFAEVPTIARAIPSTQSAAVIQAEQTDYLAP